MDIRYQVVRPFANYMPGAILLDKDIVTTRRAQQLVELRYLMPLSGGTQQPTVGALRAAPIRELRLLIEQVQDACLVQAALEGEDRQVACSIFEKRLTELEGQNAEYAQ